MGLTQDDIIQGPVSGSYNATTGTVSLPNPTSDGTTVVVCLMHAGATNPTMTGFTRPHGVAAGGARPYILYKPNVAAGENNWATGVTTAFPTVWFAMEIANLSRLSAPETWSNPAVGGMSSVTSIASATSISPSYSYETLSFCFAGGINSANATVPTFSGHTGDFVELAEVSRTDGATATAAQLSMNVGVDIGSYQSTVTSSVTLSAANSTIVTFTAEGARRVPNLDVLSGAEFGTTAGITTGVTGAPVLDFRNGSVSVVTTSPRTGTYCFEASGTSAAANFGWTTAGAMGLYTMPSGFTLHRQMAVRFAFFMPSLPAGDLTLASLDNGTGLSGAGAQVVYRSASQKIGVQIVESSTVQGTEVLSGTTVSAGVWHTIDFAVDMTNRTRAQRFWAFWRLNDVDQVTAEVTTSLQSTVATFSQLAFGWRTASTGNVRFDDIAAAKHPGSYPLGDIKVHPLTVDTSSSAAVTTAANFSTFTANGTINSTFVANTARDAVDELPVTVGGSADGFVQDATGASDYVTIPLNTRNLATNLEALRGIRLLCALWANTASTPSGATLGIRTHDGTDEITLFAAAETNAQNSTTAPAWMARMLHTLSSATPPTLSQTRLDALVARIGFSTDALPLVGVHAVMAEVAVRAAQSFQVAEADGATLYAYLDPDTNNVVALRLVAPADGDAWGYYVINGSPVNRTASAGLEDLYVIGAETNQTVSAWSCGRV
jgi:hypothetical protein